MAAKIGIEFLSVFNLPPIDFVNLAADLGCETISTGLTSSPFNPLGQAEWSLRDNASLREQMVVALYDRNITIGLGEGFAVREHMDVAGRYRDLALMAELGVGRINTISLEPDLTRSFDQFAALAELAAEFEMETTLEFGPGMTIGNLAGAVEAVRHVNRPDFKLLIDTMHLLRSGGTAADVAALPAGMIGYVQLCDSPLNDGELSYMEEAMFERMAPGTGELPLLEVVAALPADMPLSLEIPQLTLARAGVDHHERLVRCVAATRTLWAAADRIRGSR